MDIEVKKSKLFWVGDDFRSKTGYGRVARELFPFLKKKYDIILFALYGYQGISSDYYVINPNVNASDPNGFIKLANSITVLRPDIVIILNDAKFIYYMLSTIKLFTKHKCIIIPYVCTEYIGIPRTDIDLYNELTSGILAMANFTIDEFLKNGYHKKTMRLSHGYAETIKPFNKQLAKKILGIDPETFVFFSGSKNQPRKRLDIIIRAYVHLLSKLQSQSTGKKVLLMMNCGLIDIGWDLRELYMRLCNEQGIINGESYISFCSNNINDSNKSDDELTIIYNASDVGITTSTGESFGLIPFEQSALGIPQIIPNWGGIIESIKYGAIKVEPNDYYVYPIRIQSAGGEAVTVSYKDVAIAMETYLTNKELFELHCQEVKRNIEGYSWEVICADLCTFLSSFSHEHNKIDSDNNKDLEIKTSEIRISETINTWTQYIETKLIKHLGKAPEGNIYSSHKTTEKCDLLRPKQINFIEFITTFQPKTVLEIGFNGGFSALLMKIAKPDILLTCIDINEHNYVIPCYDQISKDYQDITLILESSTSALPKLISSNKTYDTIHIDGSHRLDIATQDLELCLKLSHKGTVIIFDDTNVPYLYNLCSRFVQDGHLREYNFKKVEGINYNHRFLEVV